MAGFLQEDLHFIQDALNEVKAHCEQERNVVTHLECKPPFHKIKLNLHGQIKECSQTLKKRWRMHNEIATKDTVTVCGKIALIFKLKFTAHHAPCTLSEASATQNLA